MMKLTVTNKPIFEQMQPSWDVDTIFGCGERYIPVGSIVGELSDGTLLSVSFT